LDSCSRIDFSSDEINQQPVKKIMEKQAKCTPPSARMARIL
jgi:hypothetical protein